MLTVVPESMHLLSLLRTYFGQLTWKYQWIFRPWHDILSIVAHYDFFDHDSVIPDAIMEKALIAKPHYTFPGLPTLPIHMRKLYASTHTTSRIFWSLYCRINLAASRRVVLNDRAHCALYYKLKAFEQAHLALMSKVRVFMTDHQRIPLDTEISPVEDPDTLMDYTLDPDDAELIQTHEEEYTRPTPLDTLRDWYTRHNDGDIPGKFGEPCCQEFMDTVIYVRKLSLQTRTLLFQECEPTWTPPKPFVFNPAKHTILLALMMRVHWATKEAQAVIDEHGRSTFAPDTEMIINRTAPIDVQKSREPPTRDKQRLLSQAHTFISGVDILLENERWWLPTDIREGLLYPLKLFITTHLHLARAMVCHSVYDDRSLTTGFVDDETRHGAFYNLYYPSQYTVCGEDILENQNVGYLYVSFFTEPRPDAQVWYRTQAAVWIRYFQNKKATLTLYRDAVEDERFCTWLSTICRTTLVGTYRHSSVVVPFRWQLAAFHTFMPRFSGKDAFLSWLHDNEHIARIAVEEHALMQLRTMPVLLKSLREHYKYHRVFEYYVLQISDDIRRIISSPLRDIGKCSPDIEKDLHERFANRARRKPAEPSSLPPRRRKKPPLGPTPSPYDIEMMNNIGYVIREYMQFCERGLRGLNHRTYSQKEFIDEVLGCFIKRHSLDRPKTTYTDPTKPLDSAFNVVPEITRMAMERYARSIPPTEDVSFLILRKFGFSKRTIKEIENIEVEFRCKGNHVKINELFDGDKLTDFECYGIFYFFDVIAQSKCVVPTLLLSADLVANQIRAVARNYDKDVTKLTPMDAELVVSTRRRENMGGTEICTYGVYGRGYDYFTGKFDDATKEARIRQKCMHSVDMNPPLSMPIVGFVITLFGIHLCSKYPTEKRTLRGKLIGSQPPTASSYTAPDGLRTALTSTATRIYTDEDDDDKELMDTIAPRNNMQYYLQKIKTSTVTRPHTCLVKCDRCGNTVQYFPEIMGPYRGHLLWCGNCPSEYNVRYFLKVCFVCKKSIPQQSDVTTFCAINDATFNYIRIFVCPQCVAHYKWLSVAPHDPGSRHRVILLSELIQYVMDSKTSVLFSNNKRRCSVWT